jgi:hypothetical protein
VPLPAVEVGVLGLEDEPVEEPDIQNHEHKRDEPGGQPFPLVAVDFPVLDLVGLVPAGTGQRARQGGVRLVVDAGGRDPVIQQGDRAADGDVWARGRSTRVLLLGAWRRRHIIDVAQHRQDERVAVQRESRLVIGWPRRVFTGRRKVCLAVSRRDLCLAAA